MRGLAGALVLIALLAGCSAQPSPNTPPKGLTQAEAEQRVADGMQLWWTLTAHRDEPMPTAEPIEYVDPADGVDKPLECFTEKTGLPSATYDQRNGFWRGPDGERLTDGQNRVLFVCNLQYPTDLSDPAAAGMYTADERGWAWNYQHTRLVPCLQLMGYPVENRDDGYIPSTPWWDPYDEVKPAPSAEQWELIDARCPPSPYGPTRNT
ncbi:MAG: hypothetical protein JWR04_1406 [Rhodoglobus sp.]|nr:hypothetical protein [Rhodoglobus sp.]